MKKQLGFSALTTLILYDIPWLLNSQGKFKFPRPLPMKRRTTLVNLMGRTAKTCHCQASCVSQLEHLKTLLCGRKAASPEFSKTCGAQKRLLAGMEKVVEMGGNLRDSWFPNGIYDSIVLDIWWTTSNFPCENMFSLPTQGDRCGSIQQVSRTTQLEHATWLDQISMQIPSPVCVVLGMPKKILLI